MEARKPINRNLISFDFFFSIPVELGKGNKRKKDKTVFIGSITFCSNAIARLLVYIWWLDVYVCVCVCCTFTKTKTK